MTAPDAGRRVLVIGIGNPDRGADGAGRRVAEDLGAQPPAGVSVRGLRGEALELMAAWRGADAVVLIDAVRTGTAPGTVLRFDASDAPLPAASAATSSHGLGLATALELARALGALPPRVIVLGIEGDDFGAGAAPSRALRQGIAEAGARAAAEAAGLAAEQASDHA